MPFTTKKSMKDFPFVRALRNAEDPWRILFQCAATIFIIYFEFLVAKPAFAQGGGDSMFGLATTLILGLALNILWRNAIIDFVCSPLTSLLTGGNEVADKKPLYSAAIARRNRAQYYEAIAEVRKQLDKFPNDLEGVLLLAGIQAENMKDLPAAEITVNRFCARATTTPTAATIALTQLADWHLAVYGQSNAAGFFKDAFHEYVVHGKRLRKKLQFMLEHLDMHPHLIPNNVYLGKQIPIAGVGHQSGTCRFGTDPKTSVLNVNCQTHEVDNLYVVDTSFFPGIGAVNPSLTAIANALRVGEHLLQRLK